MPIINVIHEFGSPMVNPFRRRLQGSFWLWCTTATAFAVALVSFAVGVTDWLVLMRLASPFAWSDNETVRELTNWAGNGHVRLAVCEFIYTNDLALALSESRGTQTCAIWVTAFLSLSSNDWICRKNVRFCRELKGLPKGYYRVGYRILADINVTLQDVLLNSKMTHLVYLRELSRLGG